MACDKEPSHSLFTTLEPVVRVRSCLCISFPPLCSWGWRSHAAHTVGCLAENHTSELFSTTEIQSGLDTWPKPGFSSLWAAPCRNNLKWLSWEASLRLMGQEHLSTRITPFSLLMKSSNQNTSSHSSLLYLTHFRRLTVNESLLNGQDERKASLCPGLLSLWSTSELFRETKSASILKYYINKKQQIQLVVTCTCKLYHLHLLYLNKASSNLSRYFLSLVNLFAVHIDTTPQEEQCSLILRITMSLWEFSTFLHLWGLGSGEKFKKKTELNWAPKIYEQANLSPQIAVSGEKYLRVYFPPETNIWESMGKAFSRTWVLAFWFSLNFCHKWLHCINICSRTSLLPEWYF